MGLGVPDWMVDVVLYSTVAVAGLAASKADQATRLSNMVGLPTATLHTHTRLQLAAGTTPVHRTGTHIDTGGRVTEVGWSLVGRWVGWENGLAVRPACWTCFTVPSVYCSKCVVGVCSTWDCRSGSRSSTATSVSLSPSCSSTGPQVRPAAARVTHTNRFRNSGWPGHRCCLPWQRCSGQEPGAGLQTGKHYSLLS